MFGVKQRHLPPGTTSHLRHPIKGTVARGLPTLLSTAWALAASTDQEVSFLLACLFISLSLRCLFQILCNNKTTASEQKLPSCSCFRLQAIVAQISYSFLGFA